jgi:hypothetical protein
MLCTIFRKALFILAGISCLFVLESYVLNAQLRTRTSADASEAQTNGYWYNPSNYQFQIAYPVLQDIPPLSTGMDYEILLAYIYLDSIMRSYTKNDIGQIYHNWNLQNTYNDTLSRAVKYLYKLKDYDPIRFYQYMHSLGNSYNISLNGLISFESMLFDKIVLNSQNQIAMNDLNHADYILKIHVNSINSLPRREYPNLQLISNEYIYQVNADVNEILKGQVIYDCNTNQTKIKKNLDKPSTPNITICFDYITGPYSNDVINFKVDPSLLNNDGNLTLQSGQDLIVFLYHCNYLWDYNYDYFNLTLIKAFPIVNEQVLDISNEWSRYQSLNYLDWKNLFLQDVNLLLMGGY